MSEGVTMLRRPFTQLTLSLLTSSSPVEVEVEVVLRLVLNPCTWNLAEMAFILACGGHRMRHRSCQRRLVPIQTLLPHSL